MAKALKGWLAAGFGWYEPVVCNQGAAGVGGTVADRLDGEKTIGFA